MVADDERVSTPQTATKSLPGHNAEKKVGGRLRVLSPDRRTTHRGTRRNVDKGETFNGKRRKK